MTAWLFVDKEGNRSTERPTDGRPFTIEILDPVAFEEAVRSGRFYSGLGGPITDIRKTTG